MQQDTRTESTTVDTRARMVAALRELADWLEANPAAPVGEFDRAILQSNTWGTRGDRFQRTRDIAAAVGLAIDEDKYGRNVAASKTFGPVEYLVYAS